MFMIEQSQGLLMPLMPLVILFFNPVILIPVIIIIIILVKKNKEYKSGAYYQVTKFPYFAVLYNTGRYGEYLTYKHLKQFEENGAKFLFNVYIPKGNGETTEIDVLMICSKGIFVFESKNYSGWIFGSESQKNWYQTLPAGRGRSHKEYFYNPVMQNQSHIKYLKAFLDVQVPMWSVIVFSDRCTLKNVKIKSDDISVIKRYNVAPIVTERWKQTPTDLLSQHNIADIYDKLYPCTQVDESTKEQHISNNRSNHKGQPVGVEPVLEVMQPQDVESDEQKRPETKAIESQIVKCPRCSGNLVLRNATRGVNAGKQFYGCTNYPRCKYIQNI